MHSVYGIYVFARELVKSIAVRDVPIKWMVIPFCFAFLSRPSSYVHYFLLVAIRSENQRGNVVFRIPRIPYNLSRFFPESRLFAYFSLLLHSIKLLSSPPLYRKPPLRDLAKPIRTSEKPHTHSAIYVKGKGTKKKKSSKEREKPRPEKCSLLSLEAVHRAQSAK